MVSDITLDVLVRLLNHKASFELTTPQESVFLTRGMDEWAVLHTTVETSTFWTADRVEVREKGDGLVLTTYRGVSAGTRPEDRHMWQEMEVGSIYIRTHAIKLLWASEEVRA